MIDVQIDEENCVEKDVQQVQQVGIFRYQNNQIYEGQYKIQDDTVVREGKGQSIEFYDGDWINDQKEGQGLYQYINGDIYEGEFKQDLFDGQGKYIQKNGQIIEGNWDKGQLNGTGEIKNERIHIIGQFQNSIYNQLDQDRLNKEKEIQIKKQSIIQTIEEKLEQFKNVVFQPKKEQASNLKNIFAVFNKNIFQNLYKGKLKKFEDIKLENWQETFTDNYQEKLNINVIQNSQQIKILNVEDVLQEQFTDNQLGQIVEIQFTNCLSMVYCFSGEDYKIIHVELSNQIFFSKQQNFQYFQNQQQILQ